MRNSILSAVVLVLAALNGFLIGQACIQPSPWLAEMVAAQNWSYETQQLMFSLLGIVFGILILLTVWVTPNLGQAGSGNENGNPPAEVERPEYSRQLQPGERVRLGHIIAQLSRDLGLNDARSYRIRFRHVQGETEGGWASPLLVATYSQPDSSWVRVSQFYNWAEEKFESAEIVGEIVSWQPASRNQRVHGRTHLANIRRL